MIFFTFSCVKRDLSPVDYFKYFNNESSGLIKEQVFEHMHFQMYFTNNNILGIKQALGDINNIKKNINEIEDLSYFIFKIHSDNKKDPFYIGAKNASEYSERVRYANSEIIKDFTLEYNNQKYECKYVLFEPSHNISNEVTFSIVFQNLNIKKEVLSDIKLIYDDKLFDLGIMKFNFKSQNIKDIPNLKI